MSIIPLSEPVLKWCSLLVRMLLLLVAICLESKRFNASELVISWVSWNCPAKISVHVHFFAYPDKHLFLNPSVSTAVLFYLRINPALMSSRAIYLYRHSSSVIWNIFWCLSELKAHLGSMSIIKKKLNACFDVDISGAFSKGHCIEMLDEWLSVSTKPFLFCFSTTVCGPLSHAGGNPHLPSRGAAAELPIHKHPQRRHLVCHSCSNTLQECSSSHDRGSEYNEMLGKKKCQWNGLRCVVSSGFFVGKKSSPVQSNS